MPRARDVPPRGRHVLRRARPAASALTMTARSALIAAAVASSLVLLAGGLLVAAATPAGAHSFLVSTTPGQGERLSGSPESVVLEFSEIVDATTVELSVRDASNRPIEAAPFELAAGGLSVRSSLPPLDDGVYVVSWQAFSAVDGHGTFGEHSFGVGDVGEGLPSATTSSSSGQWGTVASWLFFVGFATAAGSLVVQLLAGGPDGWDRSAVRAGLVVALAGTVLSWADRTFAGTTNGLVLATISVASVAAAMSAHAVSRRPAAPLGLLFAGAVSWSARSHAASIAGLVGAAVDAVHLVAGGIWVGALVAVAVRLWRARDRGEAAMAVVRRYSRLALGLVVTLAGAGTVSALQLVPTWDDLWTTGYGRLLVVKVGLFGAAIVLAAIGRWGGLRSQRRRLLRCSTTAEGAVVVAALVVAGLVANVAPPAPASAAEALLGPPPLEGALARDAGLAGQLNVEVVSDGMRIDVKVFSPSGPVPGTEVAVTMTAPGVEEADLLPRPCGPGCYTQELALTAGATAVRVTASAPAWTGGTYEASLAWPPGPVAAERLDQVVSTMRAVPNLELFETVDSGPGSRVVEQRIDLSGADFIAAEPYAGGNVSDVRALPGPPERLALYVPGSQIFAVLVLDDQGRIVTSRLTSPGHDIMRRFSYRTP